MDIKNLGDRVSIFVVSEKDRDEVEKFLTENKVENRQYSNVYKLAWDIETTFCAASYVDSLSSKKLENISSNLYEDYGSDIVVSRAESRIYGEIQRMKKNRR